MTLSIQIIGYGMVHDPRVQEFLVLVMRVQQGGGSDWTIYRRIESFMALGMQLPFAPPCPPPRHVPDSIELMRDELAGWLSELALMPLALQSRSFREFLSTEANLPPPGFEQFSFPSYIGNLDEMKMDDLFGSSMTTSTTTEDHFGNESDDDMDPTRTNYSNKVLESKKNMRGMAPKLEDFVLLKVIGKGSFGKVIQVRKQETGMIYAMKVLRKENIIKRNQVEHTRTERQVLGNVQHPFVVGLNYAFQTHDKLYFVLDYCAGGELFFHLGKVQRFNELRARFYSAEIVLALEYMHSLDIIYRDLKPENVLLDERGHVKLTDFGLSKEGIQDNFSGAHSFCGTPEYLAPEILNRLGHGRAVDWWSLGALLYEMLTGLPPFYSRDRDRLFDKIRRGDLTYPKYLSENAKHLLQGLLEKDPTKRLGTGIDDAEEIKSHPFFHGISWNSLFKGQIDPPWRPSVSGSLDTSQFDSEFTSMPLISPPRNAILGSGDAKNRVQNKDDDALFQGFTYTEESVLKEQMFSRQL